MNHYVFDKSGFNRFKYQRFIYFFLKQVLKIVHKTYKNLKNTID